MEIEYKIRGNPVNFPSYCDTEFHKQGHWGEMLVKQVLEDSGHTIIMNPDRFGIWDMVSIDNISGKSESIQVKTVSRYVTRKYFSVAVGKTLKTLESILKCDKLIIVVKNSASYPDKEYAGRVLLVKDHKKFTSKDGEFVIPDNMENFELIYNLSSEELKQVDSFNTSKSSI